MSAAPRGDKYKRFGKFEMRTNLPNLFSIWICAAEAADRGAKISSS